MKRSITFYLMIFGAIYVGFKLLLGWGEQVGEPFFFTVIIPIMLGTLNLVGQFARTEKRVPTRTERDKLLWPCLLIVCLYYVSCAMFNALGLPDFSGFSSETGIESRINWIVTELLFGFFVLMVQLEYGANGLARKFNSAET